MKLLKKFRYLIFVNFAVYADKLDEFLIEPLRDFYDTSSTDRQNEIRKIAKLLLLHKSKDSLIELHKKICELLKTKNLNEPSKSQLETLFIATQNQEALNSVLEINRISAGIIKNLEKKKKEKELELFKKSEELNNPFYPDYLSLP